MMNKTVFSLIFSVAALPCASAHAALQSGLLATRFQEEIGEAVAPTPAARAEGIVRNGDEEAFALADLEARAGMRGVRDEGRVTRFMSEAELEATAASLGLAEFSDDEENAMDLAEALIGGSGMESDFAQVERVAVTFSEATPSAAVVAETPAPAAFALMLTALGLGGVVLRGRRKAGQAA